MNGQAPTQATDLKPYVRPSRFELEPAMFTLAVVAVVMSICAWNPVAAPQQQQAAPTDATSTVAQAPRS